MHSIPYGDFGLLPNLTKSLLYRALLLPQLTWHHVFDLEECCFKLLTSKATHVFEIFNYSKQDTCILGN